MLSPSTFKVAPAPGEAPCSIEVWIEPTPSLTAGTILTFYAQGAPRQVSLYQYYTELDLLSVFQEGHHGNPIARLPVHDILQQGKPAFITVTSGEGQTSVYVDGVRAKRVVSFPFSGQDLAGQLIIANQPKTGDGWAGVLRGLALFSQDLTPARVLHHYETWTKIGRPDINKDDRAIALYLLDEGEGSLVHSQISAETDLHIPERFLVVDKYFLEPFWREYRPSWSYYQDVLVNIAGFVPLGFVFFPYLSLAGWVKRPALATILLGFTVSLTIEVTQAFLPTRGSGMTDLITNTSGTALGIWVYRWVTRKDLLAKVWVYLSG